MRHLTLPPQNHVTPLILQIYELRFWVQCQASHKPRKENFTHVLQDPADKSDLNLEVLNMGIIAAEPNNYLALLKKDAVLMNADEVCVVFFVGNDIIQAHL